MCPAPSRERWDVVNGVAFSIFGSSGGKRVEKLDKMTSSSFPAGWLQAG